MNDKQDRRRHKRYRTGEDAFSVLSPSPSALGRIEDISMGGLIVRYLDLGQEEKTAHSHLSLLVTGQGIQLENIPFRTVSDQRDTSGPTFGSLPMRRRHIEFGELTGEQRELLERFIALHGVQEKK